MRIVLQRVKKAELCIEGKIHSSIQKGLLVLLGVEVNDDAEDAEWLAAKISSLRIFSDGNGKMNLDLAQAGGELLIVSQFTLQAFTKKGNRPSFTRAAPREKAIALYECFISCCEKITGHEIKTGVFGTDMEILLINDGPVTFVFDSKNRE